MSRVANSPVNVPNGVEVKLDGRDLSVKGSKGALTMTVDEGVQITQEDNTLTFAAKSPSSVAMSGTTRALVNNMVVGVSDGFERRLLLNGVGYRAAVQGKKLNLTVG
nr:50S ribosomal protein L6 [Halieaceae bacterium]